jgi:hypothetical protein
VLRDQSFLKYKYAAFLIYAISHGSTGGNFQVNRREMIFQFTLREASDANPAGLPRFEVSKRLYIERDLKPGALA